MSLWRGTVCTNCKKEHECAEAERMFKSGAIVYGCSACVPKPQTNADRILSMSIEELSKWFGTHACCMADPFFCTKPGGSCRTCWLSWLKTQAEEVQDGT